MSFHCNTVISECNRTLNKEEKERKKDNDYTHIVKVWCDIYLQSSTVC